LHLKNMLVDFKAFEYVESVNLKKQKWRWCNEKECQFFNVTYNQEPRFTSTKPWILHSMYIMSLWEEPLAILVSKHQMRLCILFVWFWVSQEALNKSPIKQTTTL
jgi:hypothetical protein